MYCTAELNVSDLFNKRLKLSLNSAAEYRLGLGLGLGLNSRFILVLFSQCLMKYSVHRVDVFHVSIECRGKGV